MNNMISTSSENTGAGSVYEVFLSFLKLGVSAFGGPVAHIGYFRHEFVERRAWLTESQFGQLLAICQFIPGPASSQMGFALGLLRAGWLGAIAAFLAFTVPSVLLLIGFARLFPLMSGTVADASLQGLKLLAVVVVSDAVWGMSKKLCPDIQRRAIALGVVAMLLILDTAWLQLACVFLGAIAGILLCRDSLGEHPNTSHVPYGKRLGFGLLVLFFSLLLLTLVPVESHLYTVAQEFYRAGAMVFGGGHVVLPLLEESVVTTGWVTKEDFLAGYGAAQAVPGPLFTFSAYLGAIISTEYPIWSVIVVALFSMFLPGFLLVSAALPLWQDISRRPIAGHAIAGINAAVVGLLAVTLYNPVFVSGISSPSDLIIGVIGIIMLRVWQLSCLWVLFWCLLTKWLFLIFS